MCILIHVLYVSIPACVDIGLITNCRQGCRADVERYRMNSKIARTPDTKYDTTRINKLIS